MKQLNELMASTRLNAIPILLFCKDGSLMHSCRVDRGCNFETKYYLLVKEKHDCYVFKLLQPYQFCGQIFLKESETTVKIRKNCILGHHVLWEAIIANEISLHQDYTDFIKGEFLIAKNFQETIIWQSNLRQYSGEAKLEYKNGEENFLEIIVVSKNHVTHIYKLNKYQAITIPLENTYVLKAMKQNSHSEAAGQYIIKVHGEITQNVKF